MSTNSAIALFIKIFEVTQDNHKDLLEMSFNQMVHSTFPFITEAIFLFYLHLKTLKFFFFWNRPGEWGVVQYTQTESICLR